MCIRDREQCASAPDGEFDVASINSVKAALMGPLAGIGDSFFWGTFRVIGVGVGAPLAVAGNKMCIRDRLIPVEKPCNAELFLCQYSSSQPLPDSLKSRSIVIIKYYPTQANLRLIDSLLVLLANDELFYEDLRTNPDLGTLDSYLSHWL